MPCNQKKNKKLDGSNCEISIRSGKLNVLVFQYSKVNLIAFLILGLKRVEARSERGSLMTLNSSVGE